MEITLNNIIQNLQEIADKHQQIHGFKFGVTQHDFDTSGTSDCPEMWVTLQPSPIGISTTEFSFSMALVDAVRRGKNNQTEVLSDLAQIAKDIISQLRHEDYGWDFSLGQKPALNFAVHQSTYNYAEVSFDFTLTIPDPIDSCRIPFSSSPTIYPTQ